MTEIKMTGNAIVLENSRAVITVGCDGAAVKSILDKKSGRDIKGADTAFFSLVMPDKKTEFKTLSAAWDGDTVKVMTEGGDFDVRVRAFNDYFEFELVSPLPEGSYKARIAHAKYSYDPSDKKNTGACGIALTWWMNPLFYPDSKNCETMGEVHTSLIHQNGRYALIIAPIEEQRELIKTAARTIVHGEGIYSEVGGAWGRDSRLCFGNYTIQYESSKEFIDSHIGFFKEIGVDQVDFHQGSTTFRQGDFKFERYESAADFKANVSDVFAARGLASGLHTYSFYMRYDCPLLGDPKWQKDLGVLDSFTLAEDVGADADFLPTAESTESVNANYEFFSRNTPLILVGNEIMRFVNRPDGFGIAARGCAGSAAVPHKKGEIIRHIDGYYGGAAPIPGSDLYLEIARLTAKAFNEGGFTQIYLDALDGIIRHCDGGNESWYYTAQFVCGILKYTDTYPLFEYSTIEPSIWPARGRVGAVDTPFRAYKAFNLEHMRKNRLFIDRYSAPTMGWYNFYPTTDRYPGNEHTKYHHTDAIEHMGSIAVMYDFSNVFNGLSPAGLERYAGLKRNVALYKQYDDLRKAGYFDEAVLEKLRNGPYEYHLKQKRGGKWVFVEKDYRVAKLYDLSDPARNRAEFRNPFGAQMPFLRIEALMSSAGSNPLVLWPFDETRELGSYFKPGETRIGWDFGGELNLAGKLAKKVRVLGNGKRGSAVCIKTRCASNSEHGFGEYIIDTDYEGWREFILLEADNGERPDLPFDRSEGYYAIYRSGLNHDRITRIELEYAGDISGVRMSSVTACDHIWEVLKNPTVKVGDGWILFECELMSSDFIEFDGKEAKVIDRFGNEKKIWFCEHSFKIPRGKYTASLEAHPLNGTVARAQLTVGLTGREIK